MKQQSCAQVDARLQGVTVADHSRHDMQRVAWALAVARRLFVVAFVATRHLQADCQDPGSAPEPYAR